MHAHVYMHEHGDQKTNLHCHASAAILTHFVSCFSLFGVKVLHFYMKVTNSDILLAACQWRVFHIYSNLSDYEAQKKLPLTFGIPPVLNSLSLVCLLFLNMYLIILFSKHLEAVCFPMYLMMHIF